MKKYVWILGLSFFLVFVYGLDAHSQPKEVTEPGITTYYVTSKVLPVGEGRVYMSYEAIGTNVNDAGDGLFHNSTVRCLGGMTFEKGVFEDERGWCSFNLQDGDKVFSTYKYAGQAKPGGTGFSKGTVTLMGGTGKCAGIQGSFELTRFTPRSALEGIGQSYTKGNIKYKLP